MSAALGLIALALALGALALSSFYAAVTFAGVVGTKRAPTGDAGPIAVIIPAHDEEASIALAIGDLKPQLRAQDRLIVVADNCADRTAAVARSAGATVIERDDGAQRGKGFALQFALDALRPAPPDIVCVVDADCRIEKGAIALIAGAAAKSGRPAQSLDLMVAPAGAPPRLAVAEFAWLLMNKVRVRGLYSLFDASRLCGTGMAFPWKVIEARSLATSEIVEDLALGLDLAAAGAAPVFCGEAVVRSEFPLSDAAAVRQRARWEHGSLRVATRKAPALFVKSLLQGNVRAAALAADVMIPPLTVFAGVLVGVFGLSVFAAVLGAGAALPFAAAGVALFLSATFVAWAVHGRRVLPLKSVIAVADFAFSKTRVYGAEGKASTKSWNRTERSERSEPL
ncbi:MAG: glycosyltransferase family 2 protein [Parvularculaceae bacterium]